MVCRMEVQCAGRHATASALACVGLHVCCLLRLRLRVKKDATGPDWTDLRERVALQRARIETLLGVEGLRAQFVAGAERGRGSGAVPTQIGGVSGTA